MVSGRNYEQSRNMKVGGARLGVIKALAAPSILAIQTVYLSQFSQFALRFLHFAIT